MAGLLLPLLLYTDDIALLAQCHVLASLSLFYEWSGLIVSLTKTEWVLRVWVPREYIVGDLTYWGKVLKHSSSFKYLGLEISSHSLASMA